MRGVDSLKAVREDPSVTAELIAKQSEAVEDEAPELHEVLYGSTCTGDSGRSVGDQPVSHGTRVTGIRQALARRSGDQAGQRLAPSYFSADGREVAVHVPTQVDLARAAVAQRVIRNEMSPDQKKALIARLESEITDGKMLPAPILAGRSLRQSRLPIIEKGDGTRSALLVDRGGQGQRFSLFGGSLVGPDVTKDRQTDQQPRERNERAAPGESGGVFEMTDDDMQVSVCQIGIIPQDQLDDVIGKLREQDANRAVREVPLDRDHLIAHMARADPHTSAMLMASASQVWSEREAKQFLEEMADPKGAREAYKALEPDLRREVESPKKSPDIAMEW